MLVDFHTIVAWKSVLLCAVAVAGLAYAVFGDQVWTATEFLAPLLTTEGELQFKLRALNVTGFFATFNELHNFPVETTYDYQQGLDGWEDSLASFRNMIDSCEEAGIYAEFYGMVAIVFGSLALFCSFQRARRAGEFVFGSKKAVVASSLTAFLVSTVPWLMWEVQCNGNLDYEHFTTNYTEPGMPLWNRGEITTEERMGTGHLFAVIAQCCFLVVAVCTICLSKNDKDHYGRVVPV